MGKTKYDIEYCYGTVVSNEIAWLWLCKNLKLFKIYLSIHYVVEILFSVHGTWYIPTIGKCLFGEGRLLF